MDMKMAFLHGDVDKENCMKQPEGFKEKSKDELVCKLQEESLRADTDPKAVV